MIAYDREPGGVADAATVELRLLQSLCESYEYKLAPSCDNNGETSAFLWPNNRWASRRKSLIAFICRVVTSAFRHHPHLADITDDTIENLKEEVTSLFPRDIVRLNSEFAIAGKSTPLFKPSNTELVELDKRMRKYETKGGEPVYVRRLEITAQNPDAALKDLEICIFDYAGKSRVVSGAKRQNTTTQAYYIQYLVKDFVTAISIKSKGKDVPVSRIDAWGYTLQNLEGINKTVSQLIDFRYNVDDFVKQKNDWLVTTNAEAAVAEAIVIAEQSKIKELKEKTQIASSEFVVASEKLVVETARLNEVKINKDSLISELSSISNNKSQLSTTIDDFNDRIASQKIELEKLTNDRSLISDEFKDFVKEGKRQASTYILLALIPLLIIFACALELYNGAANILNHTYLESADLYAMLLQRVPFTAALALVITACWKIASALIVNVILIQKERMALAKLLVIAKDVVYSSASGLHVSDELKFKERIKTKLDMLREHLVSELGAGIERTRHGATIKALNEESNALATQASRSSTAEN